jgi:hypothetical protein
MSANGKQKEKGKHDGAHCGRVELIEQRVDSAVILKD